MMLARGWKKENLRGEERLLLKGDKFVHLDASTRRVFQPLVGWAMRMRSEANPIEIKGER
jgi:hypothetical protein